MGSAVVPGGIGVCGVPPRLGPGQVGEGLLPLGLLHPGATLCGWWVVWADHVPGGGRGKPRNWWMARILSKLQIASHVKEQSINVLAKSI